MPKSVFLQATAAEDSPVPMPRAMVVFAHPDDEVVALGARLGRFPEACFVHATDGAPRNEQDSRAHGFADLNLYRQAREEELSRALAMAGLPDVRRERLMIPDQEASLHLASLTGQLEKLLLEQRPEVVFTHPYEGGHPDHDACAFAVHHAAALLKAQGKAAPEILEAAFYHAGPDGVEAGGFLPQTPEMACALSDEERRRKQALLDCFVTQRQTLRGFPLAYEKFRIAPSYDFQQPPNGGLVLYDQFPWGMTSVRFQALARAAEEEIAEEAASPCL